MSGLLVLLLTIFFHRISSFSPVLNSVSRSSSLYSATSSSADYDYDLTVIGAGVVGVQAALAAASAQNKRVCLIDAPRASGELMNPVTEEDLSIGAPTGLFGKALRDTSKRINVATLRGMGLREESVWNEIISSCLDLAASNAQDIQRQLNDAGVDFVEGLAAFPDTGDTHLLSVLTSQGKWSTVKTDKVLLATGSTPFRPTGIPFDGQRIFDSDSINQLSFLPKSIAITGSGIIAIEYAKIFQKLGAEVTMIIRDNVPRNALMKIGLDRDIAATLVADLVRSGIKIERGAQVASFDVPEDNVLAPITLTLEARGGGTLPQGRRTEVKCQAYLAAVGRQPNTGNANLRSAGIEVDEYGGVLVDSSLKTTAPLGNVFAAGDIVGRPFLASTGTAQGLAAVAEMFKDQENCEIEYAEDGTLCFDPSSLASNPFAVPSGIWSSPEAAYFGLSVQQAKDMDIDAGEGTALYAECLRGRVFSPNGLLKIVFDKKDGKIIGVHIVGEDACELIHYGMVSFTAIMLSIFRINDFSSHNRIRFNYHRNWSTENELSPN